MPKPRMQIGKIAGWKFLPGFIAVCCLLFFPLFSGAGAEPYREVPEKLQAALFVKILAMSKEISRIRELTIHVVNAPDAAAELRKAVGRKIGRTVLKAVLECEVPPPDKTHVLYIGTENGAEKFISFCRKNGILSITGIPGLVEKGVTLGLCIADEKPKILLNISASKEERITWNPALLKLSKIFK